MSEGGGLTPLTPGSRLGRQASSILRPRGSQQELLQKAVSAVALAVAANPDALPSLDEIDKDPSELAVIVSKRLTPSSAEKVSSEDELQSGFDAFSTAEKPDEDEIQEDPTTIHAALSDALTAVDVEEEHKKYELEKASGLRRKTILLDLHDLRDVTKNTSIAGGFAGDIRDESLSTPPAALSTLPSAAQSPDKPSTSNSLVAPRKSISFISLSRSGSILTTPDRPNKRSASVKFAEDPVTSFHSSQGLSALPEDRNSSTGTRRRSSMCTDDNISGDVSHSTSVLPVNSALTPPRATSQRSSIHPGNHLLRSSPHGGVNEARNNSRQTGLAVNTHQKPFIISVMSAVAERRSSTPSPVAAVNAKKPAGPNLEVLAHARLLCRDRNADMKAMVGAYDPYPQLWPGSREEKEKRAKRGLKKDQWEQFKGDRFAEVFKVP
ncbi:hypothetical protein BC830DRAFT_481310 [Chytriomyces sp. MP71]|nr:hypothetical protein BC830DRAFT_481310 [Chytriomyces sp. MP71]